MQHYTYLLVDFFAIIICFIFSFHRKIKFNRHFGAFLKAAILIGIPFIVWDVWFTKHGVWWFRDDYLTGWRLLGLPVEEWLFFLCIPFACVFTYFCLDKFFNLNWANRANRMLVWGTVTVCLLAGLWYHDRIYTLVTAIATAGSVLLLYYAGKMKWLGKASLVYLILMLGFFPVNGILTGTGLEAPIVNYNPAAHIGFRMGTIPVEDAVYGYTQFLLVLFFFKKFQRRDTVPSEPPVQ